MAWLCMIAELKGRGLRGLTKGCFTIYPPEEVPKMSTLLGNTPESGNILLDPRQSKPSIDVASVSLSKWYLWGVSEARDYAD